MATTKGQLDPHILRPIILSIVVAERLIQDVRSGQCSVVNILANETAQSVPHVIPELWVLVETTYARTSPKLTLRIVDVDEERPPVFEVQHSDSADPTPTGISQFTWGIPRLSFAAYGEYRFQIWWNSGTEKLIERPLWINPPARPIGLRL